MGLLTILFGKSRNESNLINNLDNPNTKDASNKDSAASVQSISCSQTRIDNYTGLPNLPFIEGEKLPSSSSLSCDSKELTISPPLREYIPKSNQDSIIIAKLIKIINQYGSPGEKNIAQFRNVMQDVLVDFERERNLLIFVLERGLVYRILIEKPSISDMLFIRSCASQFHLSWGMDESASEWAIQIWIQALNSDDRIENL